jgi:hypothetical protein
MRDHRAERTDKLFPIAVLIVVAFLLSAIFQVIVKSKGAGFGLIEGILMAIIVILGWGIIRKTRLKKYASLVNILLFITVVILQRLAYMNYLPEYFTYSDMNNLYLVLSSVYISTTGFNCFDFKITLFITSPIAITAAYLIGYV